MTPTDRAKRLKALGYRLVRDYYCPIRQRVMPYATLPDGRSGSTCVHETLDGVDERIINAEMIRSWQQ